MKKIFITLAFLASFFFLLKTVTYKSISVEPNIKGQLQKKVSRNYLEEAIYNSLQQDKLDDAKMYLGIANMMHIPISKILIKQIQSKDNIYHDMQEFSDGFFSGKANSKNSLYGSIASDFTVVGDLRDLTHEGTKLIQNKPYDNFLLGISAVGIALTVSELFSEGATAPLKVGTSLLKTAKKSGKLTKSFTKFLTQRLSKTYDKKVLKQIDFTNINSIKKALKTINLTPIKSPLKNIYKIKKHTSIADTMEILKYIDNEKDLQKVVKISQKYKKNTKGILKILGKSAFRATKKVFVFSYEFILAAISTFITFIFFMKL